jgi:hypothetical protein
MLTFNTSGDGNSAAQVIDWASGGGRTANVRAEYAAGTGTITLQATSPGGDVWIDVPGAEFTESASVPVWITRGASLRIATASASGLTAAVKVD